MRMAISSLSRTKTECSATCLNLENANICKKAECNGGIRHLNKLKFNAEKFIWWADWISSFSPKSNDEFFFEIFFFAVIHIALSTAHLPSSSWSKRNFEMECLLRIFSSLFYVPFVFMPVCVVVSLWQEFSISLFCWNFFLFFFWGCQLTFFMNRIFLLVYYEKKFLFENSHV